jgi:proteasome accessory factor B
MLRIHELLMERKFPNCSKLAVELEVSQKTARRDIDFMRDQLLLPIEYDAAQHGYFYTREVTHFPTMFISEGELVALLVAQKALEQYRGTPFEKPIASAFAKLASAMGGETKVSLHELAEAFSFKPASLASAEMACFTLAADSVMHRREVTFVYEGLADGTPKIRRLHPYHLGCVADQWYLIGFDPERGALRTFALARVHNLKQTGNVFEKPADFSVNEVLGGGFSVFQAREVQEVRILLGPIPARLAAERQWHASQSITPLPDGRAEMSLRVGIAPDLIAWILSWGPQAEVLAPPELRATIAQAHRDAARVYETK